MNHTFTHQGSAQPFWGLSLCTASTLRYIQQQTSTMGVTTQSQCATTNSHNVGHNSHNECHKKSHDMCHNTQSLDHMSGQGWTKFEKTTFVYKCTQYPSFAMKTFYTFFMKN